MSIDNVAAFILGMSLGYFLILIGRGVLDIIKGVTKVSREEIEEANNNNELYRKGEL